MTSYQTGQPVQEKTTEVAHTAVDAGSDVVATAVEQVKDVAEEASRQARNLIGEAGAQLQDQARTQQHRASESLQALSDELASMARNSGQSGLATELAHQASDHTHSIAQWLQSKQPGDVLDEVRDFARQHPGTFILGAVAAGILAGRVTRGATSAAPRSPGGSSLRASDSHAGDTSPKPAAPTYENRPAYGATPYPAPLGDAPALGDLGRRP